LKLLKIFADYASVDYHIYLCNFFNLNLLMLSKQNVVIIMSH